MNERLADLTQSSAAPYLRAAVSSETDQREARATCLNVLPVDEAWEPALVAAETELRRFLVHGPAEDEMDNVIDAERANLRGLVDRAATRNSGALATAMLESTLDQKIVTAPSEDLWAFDSAVASLSTEDLRAALAGDWSGSGPLFSVFSPSPPPRGSDPAGLGWAMGGPRAGALGRL